jgi:hypothetical protein
MVKIVVSRSEDQRPGDAGRTPAAATGFISQPEQTMFG